MPQSARLARWLVAGAAGAVVAGVSLAPYDQTLVGPGLANVFHDSAHPNLVNGQAATPQNVAAILQAGYTGSMGTMPNASANGLSQQDISDLVAFLNSTK